MERVGEKVQEVEGEIWLKEVGFSRLVILQFLLLPLRVYIFC